MKNRRYPYRIVAPIPYLPDGGVIPQYKPVDTSNVNLPQQTGGFKQNVGTMGTVGAAAAGILGTVAASGRQQNPYQANLAGNSATQQTVDSLVSLIPGVGQIYGAGKQVGQIAKNDYAAQNEFGELASTEKFNIADTIGTFIDPLSSFISGISGEGWTAQQRSKMINDKAAPRRKAYEEYQIAQLKQREVNAGLGGRYFDQNQLMQAEMGGPLNVGYYTDAVLGSSMQMGGPISKNYGYTRSDLVPMSNYNSGIDIYEEGGELPIAESTNTQALKEQSYNKYNKAQQIRNTQGEIGATKDKSHYQELMNWYYKLPPGVQDALQIGSTTASWTLNPTGKAAAALAPKALKPTVNLLGKLLPFEEGGQLEQPKMQPKGSMITSYDNDMSHAESPIQGTPVDEHGNRVVTSNTRPVAKVQGGEISYFSKKAGKSYVFSNDLFID